MDSSTTTTPAGGPRCVVVGEALVDVVIDRRGAVQQHPGGSPLNVAVGLARLDVETTLLTEIGDDPAGRQIQAHLAASGVHLADSAVRPARRTNVATAHLAADGSATYDFDLSWALGLASLPARCQTLHVGSLALIIAPGNDSVFDLVDQAHAAGIPITVDPNARPAITPDRSTAWESVARVARLATLVKFSDEDLAFLRPSCSSEQVAEELLAESARLVVLTRGDGHAVAFSRNHRTSVPAHRVPVVDTVGAGDAFMAALIAIMLDTGFTEPSEPRLASWLHAAHEVAAITVGRRGADPPRRTELSPDWPN